MQDHSNRANLIANTKTLVCLLILVTFANSCEDDEQNSGGGGDRSIGTHLGAHGRNPWRAEAMTAFRPFPSAELFGGGTSAAPQR